MIDKVLNPHKLDSVIGNTFDYRVPKENLQSLLTTCVFSPYQKEIEELSSYQKEIGKGFLNKIKKLFCKPKLNHEYSIGIIEENSEYDEKFMESNSIYGNNGLARECGDIVWYALQYLSLDGFPIIEILKSNKSNTDEKFKIFMACLRDKSLCAVLQKFDIHNADQTLIVEKLKADVRNEHGDFIQTFSSLEKRKTRKDDTISTECTSLIVKHILCLLQIMSLLGFDTSEIIQLNRNKISDRLRRNRIRGKGDHR